MTDNSSSRVVKAAAALPQVGQASSLSAKDHGMPNGLVDELAWLSNGMVPGLSAYGTGWKPVLLHEFD